MKYTLFQSQKITKKNQHNILTMMYSCDVIMQDAVIICGNFIRDVFEITKVQTKTNISQHLGKFACCRKTGCYKFRLTQNNTHHHTNSLDIYKWKKKLQTLKEFKNLGVSFR